MSLKIGISGKRHIAADEIERVNQEINDHISSLTDNGKTPFTGLSSIAEGADTLFAEIVLNVFKQPLQVILPFESAEYEKDFSAEGLAAFAIIISDEKSNVTVLRKEAPQTHEERNQAYFDAGVYIADNVAAMIFVDDKHKPAGHGGTAEILAYVKEEGKNIKIEEITVSARNSDLGDQIEQAYQKSNREALAYQGKHKFTWQSSLFCGWLAATLFAVNTGFKMHHIELFLGMVEFLLVTTAIGLVIRGKWGQYHANFLAQRIRAEQLRVLATYDFADIPITVPFLTNVEDDQLNRFISQVNSSSEKQQYVSRWFANLKIRERLLEQIDYHSGKVKRIGKKHHYFEAIKIGLAALFFVNLASHLLVEFNHHKWEHVLDIALIGKWSIFLTISITALLAAIEGILHFEDWEMIKGHSEAAEKSLTELLEKMPSKLSGFTDDEWCNLHAERFNTAASVMLDDTRKWRIVLAGKANYQIVI